MTSVVIAAYNEESVIGACLDALLADAAADEFEVVVVANGCTDGTAARARKHSGTTVVEIPVASKVAALNAGDAAASTFPRIYLDADIKLSTTAVRALRDAVVGPARTAEDIGEMRAPYAAAVPRRELDLAGRPVLVRSYYAVNRRLPSFEGSLFGRGAIAISQEGRARFDTFPDVVADDLFLDSMYSQAERVEVQSAAARIATPMTTRALVRRLVRVRRGNISLRSAFREDTIQPGVRRSDRWSWLRDVVLPHPWLAAPAVVYVVLTVVADVRARSRRGADTWAKDESTRMRDGS